MGRSLALNFLDHGIEVVGWNLEQDVADALSLEYTGTGLQVVKSLAALVEGLRIEGEGQVTILLMIKAGTAVDETLDTLLPMLSAGDVVIDGGNTHFRETRERERRCAELAIGYVGLGVSGGETGARFGPSMMAGCNAEAWHMVAPILEPIAANSDWGDCVQRVGSDGAGHFVKMVHNGIEYADMQLLAECYDLMRSGVGLEASHIADHFESWCAGTLQSYLLELSVGVLRKQDPDGQMLVDQVLDAAEQKGTGRWTVELALEFGVPIPSIASAVDARVISSMKSVRVELATLRSTSPGLKPDQTDDVLSRLPTALLAARVCVIIQGLQLIEAASEHFNWQVRLSEVLKLWTDGCIIRSRLLDLLIPILERDNRVHALLADQHVRTMTDVPWQPVLADFEQSERPAPVLSATRQWFLGLHTASLPQNLTQAQRDAFGAHTYRRIDDPHGPAIHTDWLS